MIIRTAMADDLSFLNENDHHIIEKDLIESIQQQRIYILEENGVTIGWLRYNLFWDNTPFMNLLFILEEYRGLGYGTALVKHFETQMQQLGYTTLMTSTLVHEDAIHFYLKQNYKVVGGFHPNEEEYEVILQKKLSR